MHSHYFWEENNVSAFTQLAFQLPDAPRDLFSRFAKAFIKEISII